jgi:hypothetical protein
MRRFLLRVWNALRPSRGEAGLARELEAHLSLVRDEYERRPTSLEKRRQQDRERTAQCQQTFCRP